MAHSDSEQTATAARSGYATTSATKSTADGGDKNQQIRTALQEIIDVAGTLRANQGPSNEPDIVRWNKALDQGRAALGA